MCLSISAFFIASPARLQKLHAKVANHRKDFLHKTAFHFTNTYSIICVEDLNIRNLVKNLKVSKSIHAAGWGIFCQFLAYKYERNGSQLVKVKPHFTTQNCSDCGKRVENLFFHVSERDAPLNCAAISWRGSQKIVCPYRLEWPAMRVEKTYLENNR